MRDGGSHDAAGAHPDSQKRVPGSRLPPISVPPTPQIMLQDRARSGLPTAALNPSSRSMPGLEALSTRSSRTLSTGAGVVRRRLPASSGLEPLQPRRANGTSASSSDLGALAGVAGGSGLPSAASVHKPLRAPLFQPMALANRAEASNARRPPSGEGHFGSRPHGLPLRREASPARIEHASHLPHDERRRSAAAIDGEALHGSPTAALAGVAAECSFPASPASGSPAKPELQEPSLHAATSAASAPKYAAKCAAVANLQRLFFEEVGRSGDANAAAAAALLRLAEESRPSAEV